MLKNKKATMHISIVLLVVATLVLVIAALAVFNSLQNKVQEQYVSGQEIQKIYGKAAVLDFYIRQIALKTASGENAVNSFKQEIGKYKDASGNFLVAGLKQVEEQADSKHIKLLNGKTSFDFEINLVENVYPFAAPRPDYYKISYIYDFHFEK